jgi:glutamate synthase (NADPH/NADH) large chain
VAEEVRELMSQLGFRKFEDMVGRADLIDMCKGIAHWKAKGLDFAKILHLPKVAGAATHHCEAQDHGLDKALDHELIKKAKPALESKQPVQFEVAVRNVNRTVGAMLSGEVAKCYGHAGLPEDTIHIKLKGTAGQSFGAWLAHGVTLELEGDANDYVGKGLSGGRIVVYPSQAANIKPEENIIAGNTVLYGAIGGECYLRGVAGERFAVRNSGALAVVEGVGDHGCEYMTGGTVVVLGQAGRNFAAGMSGGIAFVLDEAGDFRKRCNMAMVELEALPAEEAAVAAAGDMAGELEKHGRVDVNHLEQRDIDILLTLITRHRHYTGSTRAQDILDNFSQYLPKFVKIMPTEYRRALAEMAAAQGESQAEKIKHG